MGYFSNGSEGRDYEEQYCRKCIHDEEGCPVWLLHMLHNYEECNNKDSMLHKLIPLSEDGLTNEKCSMFVPKIERALTADERRQRQYELEYMRAKGEPQ